MIMIAPGGMREALRSKEDKYKIIWDKRKGFVKLAIRCQCPIVLAACPAADDLYEVRDSKVTKFIYKRFKLPVPLINRKKGFLPPKIKLTHILSEPYFPPVYNDEEADDFNSKVDVWHKFLIEEMNALMNDVV